MCLKQTNMAKQTKKIKLCNSYGCTEITEKAEYCMECKYRYVLDPWCHMCYQDFNCDEKYPMSEKMPAIPFCNNCILKDFKKAMRIAVKFKIEKDHDNFYKMIMLRSGNNNIIISRALLLYDSRFRPTEEANMLYNITLKESPICDMKSDVEILEYCKKVLI